MNVNNETFINIHLQQQEIFIDLTMGKSALLQQQKLHSADCVMLFVEPCPTTGISTAGWQRAPSTFPSVQLIDDPGMDPNSLQIASLTLTGSKLRQPSCFFSSSSSSPPSFYYYLRVPASVFSKPQVQLELREMERNEASCSGFHPLLWSSRAERVLLRSGGGPLLPPAGWIGVGTSGAKESWPIVQWLKRFVLFFFFQFSDKVIIMSKACGDGGSPK